MTWSPLHFQHFFGSDRGATEDVSAEVMVLKSTSIDSPALILSASCSSSVTFFLESGFRVFQFFFCCAVYVRLVPLDVAVTKLVPSSVSTSEVSLVPFSMSSKWSVIAAYPLLGCPALNSATDLAIASASSTNAFATA